MEKINITENEAGQRLDRFLRKLLKNVPLSGVYKIIRKDTKLNGSRPDKDVILSEGDELILYIDEIPKASLRKEGVSLPKNLNIIYEDANMLIVDKPFGLLVHGDKFEKRNTLTNRVIDYLIVKGEYKPRLERTFTPASVNRLDRNTTGLVVFGKNAKAVRELAKLFRERSRVKKYYLTIVEGLLDKEINLDAKLEKDESANISRVSPDGKEALSIIRPIYSFSSSPTRAKKGEGKKGKAKAYTLVEVELVTGRTHQIRVHLSNIGHPIIGDIKYGGKKIQGLTTQLLHAYKLDFEDGLSIQAEIPQFFKDIEKGISKSGD